MLKAKAIKQMQMDALETTFRGVRDFVLLSATGVGAIPENRLRLDLRKKDIRLMLVKNSLMQRVLDGMGIKIDNVWAGPTMVAWGSTSVASLSKAVETSFMALDKAKDKIKFKGAVADGQPVTFEQALKMPTR